MSIMNVVTDNTNGLNVEIKRNPLDNTIRVKSSDVNEVKKFYNRLPLNLKFESHVKNSGSYYYVQLYENQN